MATLVAALCLALGVSFVCSFVEAGLLSLTPANVADLARSDTRRGRIWMELKRDIGRPISVILLINTAAHTVGAAVAGAKWSDLFGDDYLWLFTLVFTFLMLQYTEILPKTLGVRYRMAFARRGAVPMQWAVAAFSPFISLIHAINRPFTMKGVTREEGNAVAEIASLASMARMSNLIGRRQEKIIASATKLTGITAEQVMIPLEQVTVLASTNTIQEAFLIAHTDLHTRYPVRATDGRIAGYVNFKEMVYFMSTNPNVPSFLGIIRPLTTVGLDTNASDLLKLFVDQHYHMVVVAGGDGTAVGIVTVEDVLEELVGEIEDEFDRLPQYIHSLAGGVWLAGGGTPMEEVAARLGENMGGQGQVLGAWLAEALGGTCSPGNSRRWGRYEVAVRRIKRGKIFDAVITDRFASKGGKP